MLEHALSLSGVALVGIRFVVGQLPAFVGRYLLVLFEAGFEVRSEADIDGRSARIFKHVNVEHKFDGVDCEWAGHPFSRSYGAILPSSLERSLSRALVYSTHPPVSVCGTGDPGNNPQLFSTDCPALRFARRLGSTFDCLGAFLSVSLWALNRTGDGILTICASITPYGLILAPG